MMPRISGPEGDARGKMELLAWFSKQIAKVKNGAGKRSRTSDLRITNALLYQLSYSGTVTASQPRSLTDRVSGGAV
jgi:hypothetical protein